MPAGLKNFGNSLCRANSSCHESLNWGKETLIYVNDFLPPFLFLVQNKTLHDASKAPNYHQNSVRLERDRKIVEGGGTGRTAIANPKLASLQLHLQFGSQAVVIALIGFRHLYHRNWTQVRLSRRVSMYTIRQC
jgi:hypothetical protein